MAARRRSAKAEPEVEEAAEPTKKRSAAEAPDYTKYATKEPTDLQERMAEWVIDKVGLEFDSDAEEDAFCEGVRLGVALRMHFQASPENQAEIAAQKARRAAAADEEDEAPKPARKTAAKKAPAKRRTKAEEPDEDEAEADVELDDGDEPEVEAEPAPKTTRRRAPARAAKAAPDKPAAAKRPVRRRVAKGEAAPY